MWEKAIKGRVGGGCKIYNILRDLSLVSESKTACDLEELCDYLVLPGESETAVLFWWLSDAWLNVMLRRFMQSLISLKVCYPPPTISYWWTAELSGFWLISLFFFFLHPVVFNWQHIIQSQCCQFFLLQWCVCGSNLLWPALRSLWEEESLSHR